jgi:hypothetical protein
MLAHVVDDLPIVVEMTARACRLRSWCHSSRRKGSPSSAWPICRPARHYLVKRLHVALPDVRILVGRWGPPALADESTQV